MPRQLLLLALPTIALLSAARLTGCAQPSEPISRPPALAPPAVHRAPTRVAPPWTLTASDGSGLLLVRADVKAVIEGPLAFTELHLYFHNPEPRRREGTFALTLPARAAVSRFAMEREGAWQEAEVVEKVLARRAYEDFLHRRQDPALLEKAAGNQFTARVFPIEPKADKHLVISYSQELAGEYRLPLQGLAKTERIDIRVEVGSELHELHERNWAPDRDFVATTTGPVAVTSGTLVAGAFTVAGPATADPVQAITLLVDTSASRALGFADYLDRVRELVTGMRTRYGEALELQVVAFDQATHLVFAGQAADFGDAQIAALVERSAAGASDLGQALDWLARAARHRRVAVVTDGVVTAGRPAPELIAAVGKLPIDRLDVVLAGGIRDDRLAAALVRALPRTGDVFDLDRDVPAVVTGLGEAVRLDVAIDVPGATWVFPRKLASARPGTPVTVYARMTRPVQTLEVVVGGERNTVSLVATAPALLDRAVAQAEIEELEHTLELAGATTDLARQLRKTIGTRSVAARVVSSQTAMLVLESEADYARYGIDHTSLADILVVGAHGLEQTRRTFVASGEPRAPTRAPDEDASGGPGTAMALDEGAMGRPDAPSSTSSSDGLASLTGAGDFSSGIEDANQIYGRLNGDDPPAGFGFGRSAFGPGASGRYDTIGSGRGYGSGGGGSGWGVMRGRRTNAPLVALGAPTTQGSFDKSLIRRYLKRNVAKLQYCYEKELLGKPTLEGTVTLQFTIDANGTVERATATGVDPAVASCAALVIRAIEFPRPVTGQVLVSYPMTYRRADPSSEPAPVAPVQITPAPPPRPQPPADPKPALSGRLDLVMQAIATHRLADAYSVARKWRDEAPGDVLALIALGESLEARADLPGAARTYGSIIDLYPARADFRRFAGERLERLGARKLAIDSYRRAVADRPDHATGHRLLAYALLRDTDHAGAFAAILAAIDHKYPAGRFRGAERVFAEDAGMIAAAYLAHGGKSEQILGELAKRSLEIATLPSTRFIAYWETDANDVDFHIEDANGNQAWYAHPVLRSGGELYADVTTGYGPECFAIPGTASAGPYKLSLHYYSQGPMGYGMGLLQIQRFDGKGGITFEDRPYVIMTNQATVELGVAR